jgi:hypothetical protein
VFSLIKKTIKMATSSTIIQKTAYRILLVIDTAAIKNKYSNHDIDVEESIKIEEANWFAICQKNDAKAVNSVHAVSVDFKGNDKIIISGISIDGDSSDSIILNQIHNYRSIKKSIVNFESVCLTKKTISNNQKTEDQLSVMNVDQNFIWFESLIYHSGKSKIKIHFSLYYLNSDGNQQDLYGSFWFPLEIEFY